MLHTHKTVALTVATVIAIILLLFTFSWLISRGVNLNRTTLPPEKQSSPSSDTIQNEPSNPNVTGGSTGAGNTNSNDPSIQIPSPAGGVDTNNVPAGGTSSP
jgi:hypothetical protein